MSIPARFMEIARTKLGAEVFDPIYALAVKAEREAIAAPLGERVQVNPAVTNKIAAHLNGEPQPTAPRKHVEERIERRMEIEVGPTDIGNLLQLIRTAGDPNVKMIRQYMQLVQELSVNWRGKHFNVLYNKSNERLITAYPYKKKAPKKAKTGRPKDWRSEFPP